MSSRRIHLERKAPDVLRAAETLRAALLAEGRLQATPADAVAVSGLPLAQAESALLHLASRFPARLRVSEAGSLRVTFERLEGERISRREAARRKLAAFWSRHADAVKACALLMCVPPYLLTVAAHAAALGGHAPLPFSLLAYAVAAVTGLAGIGTLYQFQLLPLMGLLMFGTALGRGLPLVLQNPGAELFDQFLLAPIVALGLLVGGGVLAGSWLLYRHYVFGDRNLLSRSLWRTIAGLLFGPSPSRDDALSDERRLTALIVERQGILSQADLVALFGWTPAEADQELVRILLDYGGDVDVSEDGAVLYRFDPMTVTAGDAPLSADTRPCYERLTPPGDFWQASPRFVGALGALSAVGLAGLVSQPAPVLFPSLAPWDLLGSLSSAPYQGLGLYPYLLVVLPVLLRWPLWLRARADHAEQARYYKAVKLAVEHADGTYLKRAPVDLLARLGGDVDVERTRADGKVWVAFPAIARAQAAASRARAERRPRADEALVAYDSSVAEEN